MSAAMAAERVAVRQPVPYSRRLRRLLSTLAANLFVLLLGLFFAAPLIWMLSVSLMTETQARQIPPAWIPSPLVLQHYVAGFTEFDFGLYFLNTFFVAAVAVVGTVSSSVVIAYGFARFRFPGREPLFTVLLATMMLPQQVTMIPQYVWFVQLGLINSFLPLLLPTFFGNAFIVFLLRQFIQTLPRELDDAAKIDGVGVLGLLWRILLPLCLPALGVAAIFVFTHHWNDLQLPLIYLQDKSLWTIAIGLLAYKQFTFTVMNGMMAMSIAATLPVIVLFFVAQRYFVQGIVMTGLKG